MAGSGAIGSEIRCDECKNLVHTVIRTQMTGPWLCAECRQIPVQLEEGDTDMLDMDAYKPWQEQAKYEGDANMPYLSTNGSSETDGQVEGLGGKNSKGRKNDPMRPKRLKKLVVGIANTSREDK